MPQLLRHRPACVILRHALQRPYCGAAVRPVGFAKQYSLKGPWLDRDKLEACAPKKQSTEELRKMIEAARVRPTKERRERSPPREPDEMGRWLCTDCQQMFAEAEFHRRTPTGLPKSICKRCEGNQKLLYCRTLRGGVIQMQGNALRRSRSRGLDATLSYTDDILDMLDRQDGTCAYSGMTMEALVPNSHWRMTLERVENSKGYVPSNCVLVAAEFNTPDFSRARNVDPDTVVGTAQWSFQKATEVPRLRRQLVDLNKLKHDIEAAKQRPLMCKSKVPKTPHLPKSFERQCPDCLEVLPREAFYVTSSSSSGMSTYCMECHKHQQRRYHASLRGHLYSCIGTARRRAISRGQEFSITLEIVGIFVGVVGGTGWPMLLFPSSIELRARARRLEAVD